MAAGSQNSFLGYPAAPEFPSFGDTVQNFQTGSIAYTPGRGITSVLSWIPNCRTCGAQEWKP
jgi:hypothetical protein